MWSRAAGLPVSIIDAGIGESVHETALTSCWASPKASVSKFEPGSPGLHSL
jgi:hypothetical protein